MLADDKLLNPQEVDRADWRKPMGITHPDTMLARWGKSRDPTVITTISIRGWKIRRGQDRKALSLADEDPAAAADDNGEEDAEEERSSALAGV